MLGLVLNYNTKSLLANDSKAEAVVLLIFAVMGLILGGAFLGGRCRRR